MSQSFHRTRRAVNRPLDLYEEHAIKSAVERLDDAVELLQDVGANTDAASIATLDAARQLDCRRRFAERRR